MKRITLLSACLIILGTFAMVRMTTIAEGPRKRGFSPPPSFNPALLNDRNSSEDFGFGDNESAGEFGFSADAPEGEFLEPAAPVFGEPVDHMGFSEPNRENEKRQEVLEMKIECLLNASALLQVVGKDELVRDLQEEAEEIERDLQKLRKQHHREHLPEGFSDEAIIHEMQKLREEVSGLRKEMRELRKVIGSLQKISPKEEIKNNPKNMGRDFHPLDRY